MMNLTDPMRILYLSLPLTRPSADRDDANVSALWYAKGWFTHVAIVTRSWQETPDAICNLDVVRRAVAICGLQDLKVIWGRNLWVSWPSDKLEAPMPTKWSYRYASYYAAAIATVKAEARAIGAVGTMLDAEPYGDSVQKEILKNEPDLLERPRILGAIGDAVSVTGKVDIIYPYDSMNPKRYTWLMAGLGQLPWGEKTAYYGHDAGAPINANPPDGMKHEPRIWTSFATEVSRQVGDPSQMTLTPAEVMAIDMDAVQVRFPSIQKRQGVYIPDAEFAEVMKGWNG